MLVDPIKDKKDIERIKELFLYRKQYRNYLLFSTGINTFLRIGDLVRLKLEDVYDFRRNTIKHEISLTDKKTRKCFRFPINSANRKSLILYLEKLDKADFIPERYLFHNGRKGNHAICEKTGWQTINDACFDLGIEGNFGSHTMRKTKAYQYYKNSKNKANALEELRKALKHSSVLVTARYIGLEKEEIDKVYLFSL